MKSKTKKLVFMALFSALVFVGTVVIRIPIPAVNGYINIGDAFILVCAALFGGVPAMVAGGLGAALGDLIGGFAHWVPATLIIKGFEGLFCGILLQIVMKKVKKRPLKVILSVLVMAVSVMIMSVGYFFASWIMMGKSAAIVAISMDLIQGGIAVGIAAALIFGANLPKILKADAKVRGDENLEITQCDKEEGADNAVLASAEEGKGSNALSLMGERNGNETFTLSEEGKDNAVLTLPEEGKDNANASASLAEEESNYAAVSLVKEEADDAVFSMTAGEVTALPQKSFLNLGEGLPEDSPANASADQEKPAKE